MGCINLYCNCSQSRCKYLGNRYVNLDVLNSVEKSNQELSFVGRIRSFTKENVRGLRGT